MMFEIELRNEATKRIRVTRKVVGRQRCCCCFFAREIRCVGRVERERETAMKKQLAPFQHKRHSYTSARRAPVAQQTQQYHTAALNRRLWTSSKASGPLALCVYPSLNCQTDYECTQTLTSAMAARHRSLDPCGSPMKIKANLLRNQVFRSFVFVVTLGHL